MKYSFFPLNSDYTQVSGFVTEAADAKQLKSFEDLYYGERLDYNSTPFSIGDGSCGVIRFTSDESATAIVPTGGSFDNLEYPFTSTGFTAGNNGRLGVPEWNLPSRINADNGSELWQVYNDGTEVLRAVSQNVNGTVKFVPVK